MNEFKIHFPQLL